MLHCVKAFNGREKLMQVSPYTPHDRTEISATKRFSVVVPVFEQWGLVPKLLSCLRDQALSKELFEVILVDNGSSSIDVPDKLQDNVHVLRCETPGSYAARNRGAERATGDWLVFTDADCQPSRDWLFYMEEACGALKGARTLVAGPVQVFSPAENPNCWEIYDIIRGIPQERYVRRGYAATANLAVPRTVFEELGGFDGRRFSGGDADLCRRALAKGCDIVFVPGPTVNHPARATWEEISTKARRIKGGQLTAGSLKRRLRWTLGTVSPPARAVWHFLTKSCYPLRYRLIAILVLFRVWLVELRELCRLCAGAEAERR